MTPACMTADELALWRDVNGTVTWHRATIPCTDCPLSFAAEMRAQGCCNGTPRPTGRPPMDITDAARCRRRRDQQAAAQRRYRARKRVT